MCVACMNVCLCVVCVHAVYVSMGVCLCRVCVQVLMCLCMLSLITVYEIPIMILSHLAGILQDNRGWRALPPELLSLAVILRRPEQERLQVHSGSFRSRFSNQSLSGPGSFFFTCDVAFY